MTCGLSMRRGSLQVVARVSVHLYFLLSQWADVFLHASLVVDLAFVLDNAEAGVFKVVDLVGTLSFAAKENVNFSRLRSPLAC